MPADTRLRFSPTFAKAIERCWKKAAVSADWNLTLENFKAALERSAAHRFPSAPPDAKTTETYLDSLHVNDLALACACSAGSPAAWDFFVAQFRPELYRAARAIAGESNARELADSLYADLYGLRETEGHRRSLFDYFHGRSKLATWLRAVLAQRHVDELRRTRRMEPIEADDGEERVAARAIDAARAPGDMPDPERPKYLAMVQSTLTVVLDSLDTRDRMRLAYYYMEELTLAEIGRLLGEHEATVSRKLDRTRRELRERFDSALRDGRKLSEAQLRLCHEYAREEWHFDLTGALSARE